MKIHRAVRSSAALLCLAAPAHLAPAQEPKPAPEPAPEKPSNDLPPMPGGQSSQEKELIELFGKVENRLRAIDTQMFEAAAGRVPTKPVAGSGIEELLKAGEKPPLPGNVAELLKSASQDSQRTQSDIQRILEIARSMNPSSSSSSSSSKSSPKDGSPLDQPGQQGSGREQTPKGPGDKPESGDPQDGDTPKDGKRPDDPNRRTENRNSKPPPDSRTGPGSGGSGADRWGDLPVRAREIFRVEGGSDLPPQYRDWIDGYYRRLQSLERR